MGMLPASKNTRIAPSQYSPRRRCNGREVRVPGTSLNLIPSGLASGGSANLLSASQPPHPGLDAMGLQFAAARAFATARVGTNANRTGRFVSEEATEQGRLPGPSQWSHDCWEYWLRTRSS